jgi:hypothetical protein
MMAERWDQSEHLSDLRTDADSDEGYSTDQRRLILGAIVNPRKAGQEKFGTLAGLNDQ